MPVRPAAACGRDAGGVQRGLVLVSVRFPRLLVSKSITLSQVKASQTARSLVESYVKRQLFGVSSFCLRILFLGKRQRDRLADVALTLFA